MPKKTKKRLRFTNGEYTFCETKNPLQFNFSRNDKSMLKEGTEEIAITMYKFYSFFKVVEGNTSENLFNKTTIANEYKICLEDVETLTFINEMITPDVTFVKSEDGKSLTLQVQDRKFRINDSTNKMKKLPANPY